MKREFLQLAQTYKPAKHGIAGWFLSEKLDGLRCLWDSGLSRGQLASSIPWANVEKDGRYVIPPVATGLWTRYGKVIHAPEWFLNNLPPAILDGELYAGSGNFQKVVSYTKKLEPVGSEWRTVTYMVFDCPRADEIFADGAINNTNFKKVFRGILENELISKIKLQPPRFSGFASRWKWLQAISENFSDLRLHKQTQLPFSTAAAIGWIEGAMDTITMQGGEGVILKSPSNLYVPERSHTMLKHKALHDAEGTVTGYIWGRETDKGSKLLGLMGALILRQDNGKTLELSGFTDEERRMAYMNTAKAGETLLGGENALYSAAKDIGNKHPGEAVSESIHNPSFPRGSRITYKYRELTDDGVAKEARYFRKSE